jgi:RNA 3'-terminal phosphate cyclase (ATP)
MQVRQPVLYVLRQTCETRCPAASRFKEPLPGPRKVNAMTGDVEAVEVDGAQGEGGGQVVRTSLALSLVTGRPVRMERIRAGRSKPGLRRQHLTAVEAAAEISAARIHGAEIGSTSLSFHPGAVQPENYHFRIGTAGSTTLVLQTILPALLTASGPSSLKLEGGTHNPWAPPFDFLQQAYLPLVNRMGPRVHASLEQPGFYPAGGGRLQVHIEPTEALRGFDLLERGDLRRRAVHALVCNLPRHIAEREVKEVLRKLGWPTDWGHVEELRGPGPGNIVWVEIESAAGTEVFTAFGRLGVRAEQVAKEVAREARDFLQTDVPVGPHLADQLLLPLALSAHQTSQDNRQRGGTFLTGPLTRHASTQIDVLQQFLDVRIDVEPEPRDQNVRVAVSPRPA